MKFTKKIVAITMAFTLMFSSTVNIVAESDVPGSGSSCTASTPAWDMDMIYSGYGIDIMFNGQYINLDNSKPYILNDIIYLPYKETLEAIGTNVTFQISTKEIKVERNSETAVFKIGSNEVIVTNGGNTKTITIDNAPIHTSSDKYISADSIAQVFDLSLGYDRYAETVFLVDKAEIMERLNPKHFTIINELNEIDSYSPTNSYSTDGTVNISLDVDGISSSATIEISGVTTNEKSDVEMRVKTDLDEVINAISRFETLSKEDQAIFNALKDFVIKMSMNAKEGKFYASSDILVTLADIPADTWFLMDIDEFYQSLGIDFNLSDLLQDSTGDTEYMRNLYSLLLDSAIDTNDSYSVASAIDSINLVNALLNDNNFVKTGNTYTSTYSIEEPFGVMNTSIEIIVDDNNKALGYSVMLEASDGFDSSMRIRIELKDKDNLIVNMDLKSSGFDLKVEGNIVYSATSKKALGEPPKDSNIIDLANII